MDAELLEHLERLERALHASGEKKKDFWDRASVGRCDDPRHRRRRSQQSSGGYLWISGGSTSQSILGDDIAAGATPNRVLTAPRRLSVVAASKANPHASAMLSA